jgi:uncharacterized OB-fold protein
VNSPDAAPFWEACKRREFLLPWCPACADFFWYPRTLCPRCGSRNVEWRQASGRGRLHAFCIQSSVVTALVELEEGPRMMSFLVSVEPDPAAIRCEMPLALDFREDGLPVFRPQ